MHVLVLGFPRACPRVLESHLLMDELVQSQTATPSLPVELHPLTSQNIDGLRRLNSTLFPVAYNERFYVEALGAPQVFHRLAYVSGVLVGAVCCRRENPLQHELSLSESSIAATVVALDSARNQSLGGRTGTSRQSKLYIMTLGVLAPYRECGIGSLLLKHVLNVVLGSPHADGIGEVYLHVQVGNDDALSFYRRHGFVTKCRLENYYRKIRPADCLYVSLSVTTNGLR